jgi:hypothetical protein
VDNDGYASYDKVISVAACSDRGDRSVYSDKGDANWCCFPSNTFGPPAPLTPGIWTTDRTGRVGYNTSSSPAGNYDATFGGTSSACPGAAGVAALVLARNPNLRADQVKNVLKLSCDKIDRAGGGYNADGHSSLYGFGRLNGLRAVELAAPAAADYTAVHTAIQPVAIKDLQTSKIGSQVGDTAPIKDVRIVRRHRTHLRRRLDCTDRPPDQQRRRCCLAAQSRRWLDRQLETHVRHKQHARTGLVDRQVASRSVDAASRGQGETRRWHDFEFQC